MKLIRQGLERGMFMTFGEKVRSLRKEKKMSQLEVALSIGQKAPGFYANMENYAHGKHFNLSHLFRIAKLFDVSIEELFKKA